MYIYELTPERLDFIETIGVQLFLTGSYFSHEFNSVKSSRPPTAYICPLYTAQPKCFRLVVILATICHLFVFGS